MLCGVACIDPVVGRIIISDFDLAGNGALSEIDRVAMHTRAMSGDGRVADHAETVVLRSAFYHQLLADQRIDNCAELPAVLQAGQCVIKVTAAGPADFTVNVHADWREIAVRVAQLAHVDVGQRIGKARFDIELQYIIIRTTQCETVELISVM